MRGQRDGPGRIAFPHGASFQNTLAQDGHRRFGFARCHEAFGPRLAGGIPGDHEEIVSVPVDAELTFLLRDVFFDTEKIDGAGLAAHVQVVKVRDDRRFLGAPAVLNAVLGDFPLVLLYSIGSPPSNSVV